MSKSEIKVKESTQYENCLDLKHTDNQPNDILDFLDIDDEEREKIEASDRKEWEKHWVGMPEFVQEDNPPYKKIIVSFRTKEDFDEFCKLIDQPMTEKTKSIWHPKLDREENSLLRWIEE